MISKRYLALLTGVAMTTSTFVVPNAVAQPAPEENVTAPAPAPNLHGDAIAGVTSQWPVNVPATATVAHSVFVDGVLNYDRQWDIEVIDGELYVTPPADAAEGEYAHIMFLDGGAPVGEAKITAIPAADNGDDADEDADDVTPPFGTAGGIEPGATEAFATNSTTTPGSDTLSIAVFDQYGTPKSDAGWSAEFGSNFAPNDISVTAPQTVVKGDYAVVTVTNSEGTVLGTVRANVQSDGEYRLRYDISGDILPGATAAYPVDVPEGATLHYTLHRDGLAMDPEGWDVEIVDGELRITAPEDALPGDQIQVASLHNDRMIGQAKLNVIAPAEEEDEREFEIRGDILAGATNTFDHVNTDGLVVSDIKVVDATGTAKSTEGWSVEVNETTGEIVVTAPEDAENGDIVAALFTRDGRVVGDLALRAIERAEDYLFFITGSLLPGITSSWPVNEEALGADLTFEVFDRDGNKKSTRGWVVEFDENGEFAVTAPNDAREGDYVEVVATKDGKQIGGARLTVAVDGEGSSTPWWVVLIPILGIAGVIALLTGGSSLSSGSSGSSGSSNATPDNNGGGNNQGGNQGGAGDGQQGPATGPVGGEDAKAAAQAQAANAPAYTPGAAAEQQTAPVAAQQNQGALANTGVQNTLIALVVGLLAAAAGVFLLMARRRNG